MFTMMAFCAALNGGRVVVSLNTSEPAGLQLVPCPRRSMPIWTAQVEIQSETPLFTVKFILYNLLADLLVTEPRTTIATSTPKDLPRSM